MIEAAPVVEEHGFLGGRLTVSQFPGGHRAGTDACLLAAALAVPPGACMADVGAGVGAVALAMLHRAPEATGVLIERDPATAALATRNVAANRMAGRARVVEADIFDRKALEEADLVGCADVVVSNPPFFEPGTARASPNARRRAAHVLDGAGHTGWLRATMRLAKARARLALIHRPEALAALLADWPGGWGAIRLLAVHPRPDAAAKRLLLSAVRGSRAPLTILPALVLHRPDGTFTEEAEAIHRGTGPHLL